MTQELTKARARNGNVIVINLEKNYCASRIFVLSFSLTPQSSYDNEFIRKLVIAFDTPHSLSVFTAGQITKAILDFTLPATSISVYYCSLKFSSVVAALKKTVCDI